jgi:hypothetical protein
MNPPTLNDQTIINELQRSDKPNKQSHSESIHVMRFQVSTQQNGISSSKFSLMLHPDRLDSSQKHSTTQLRFQNCVMLGRRPSYSYMFPHQELVIYVL